MIIHFLYTFKITFTYLHFPLAQEFFFNFFLSCYFSLIISSQLFLFFFLTNPKSEIEREAIYSFLEVEKEEKRTVSNFRANPAPTLENPKPHQKLQTPLV